MCLPMIPAGPDSEVMNPILTVSAAGVGPATSATANTPMTRVRMIARTEGLLGSIEVPRRRADSSKGPWGSPRLGAARQPSHDVLGNGAGPERLARLR